MNEKKILIGIAAATLVIASALGYGVYYTLGAIDEQETMAGTTREDIKKARAVVDSIKAAEDKVILLRESLKALASVLPTQREVEDFITQIAATKGEAGVKLSQIIDHNATAKTSSNKVFEKFSYQIGVKGNLWQFLEFLYRLESFKRFVMVPQCKIAPGQRESALAEVNHAYDLEVETYVYNPGRVGKIEPIPSYDKRREAVREEIEQAIYIIEQMPVEFGGQRGRRDIFVDPRMPSGPTKEGELPVEQQTEIVNKLRQRVEEIGGILSRRKESQSFIERFELLKQLEQSLPAIEGDINKVAKDGSITYPLLARAFQNEVKDAFEKMKALVDKGPPETGPNPRELGELVARMRENLQHGRLREAIDAGKPVLEKWSSLVNDPARKGYIEELKKLDREARIADRFEQKKIVIGGVILYEDRKAALVNGKTVEPGDSIDDDLTIADIHEDGVTFVLDSVEITKKW
ncbi:MAG: type 4a pilus biogenesis protein PilO [Planctomycetes bacterium]|nr:type 4a pilus biogenesis protein PilO [Planctomycetota bacterium]